MNKSLLILKINDMLKNLSDKNMILENEIDEIDFFNSMCKAESNNLRFNVNGFNMLGFYRDDTYKDIVMIFTIPKNESDKKSYTARSRKISDITMGILETLEDYFVYLDDISMKNIDSEPYIYLIAVKKNYLNSIRKKYQLTK